MRRSRASGGISADAHCQWQACSLWGRVSLLGACFSSWGVPWISTLSPPPPPPRPERRGSCPPRTIPTLFLLGVFLETEAAGKSPHVGAGNSPNPATSPLGGLASPRPAWLPPRALPSELRSPSGASGTAPEDERLRPESPHPAPAPARARSELTWPERGAGARGRRCPLAGAGKLSRAPSGHRSVAQLRTRGRGAAGPGRAAAGGGRGCGRQGRGGRGAAWDLRRPAGARRVLPPAPPLSPPRPASRSPPLRRVGPGRVERRREIVSTANKKRRHMTRREEGERGEGGKEGSEGEGRSAGGGGSRREGKRGPGRGRPGAQGADPPGPRTAIGPSPGRSRVAAGNEAGPQGFVSRGTARGAMGGRAQGSTTRGGPDRGRRGW